METERVNLYVKNLDDVIDDERLREEFQAFGTITSVKVMVDDDDHSKGFGFVCFSSSEEATRAVTEMNGSVVVENRLYVAVTQDKEARKAQLDLEHFRKRNRTCINLKFQPTGLSFYKPTPDAQQPRGDFRDGLPPAKPKWQPRSSLTSRPIVTQQVDHTGDTSTTDPVTGCDVTRCSIDTDPSKSPVASLYVGELHPDVTEAMLFEKFSSVGPVLSILVCRDIVTNRSSLGYAYVNFQQSADAERALETMNFDPIKGKPCRIVLLNCDPSLKESVVGKLFVKNLNKNVDDKTLNDTFSDFGEVVSCKIMRDQEGRSKGYALVEFEDCESALSCMNEFHGEKVQGLTSDGRKMYVQPTRKKVHERSEGINLYVKNLGIFIDEERLREEFQPFGTITSVKVMRDDNNRSKGFGFVSFSTTEEATYAVEKMNGRILSVKPLYVALAQRKDARQAQLESQNMQRPNDSRVPGSGSSPLMNQMFQPSIGRTPEFMEPSERVKTETVTSHAQGNLYVKNLDVVINDDRLRKEFQPFGTITSVKVMRDDNNRSKGFGFVCFSTTEEATKAMEKMNGRIVGSKPLYVAFQLSKDARKAQLALQNLQRPKGIRMPDRYAVPSRNQMFQYTDHYQYPGQPVVTGQQIRAPEIEMFEQRRADPMVPRIIPGTSAYKRPVFRYNSTVPRR